MSVVGIAPGLRRIYSRTGFADVPEIDAVTTTRQHAGEWSLEPWPIGEMTVAVPDNWYHLPASQRIELAEKLSGAELSAAGEADEVIRKFLAGGGR